MLFKTRSIRNFQSIGKKEKTKAPIEDCSVKKTKKAAFFDLFNNRFYKIHDAHHSFLRVREKQIHLKFGSVYKDTKIIAN